MKKIIILGNFQEIALALQRHFRLILGLENIVISSLNDFYGTKDIVKNAQQCDLLVIEGFSLDTPKGFQFAKAMEKRALVLFYGWELEIETEGPFWLVLPYGLDRLGNKINELLEHPAIAEDQYKKLEERFPELKEQKGHHR